MERPEKYYDSKYYMKKEIYTIIPILFIVLIVPLIVQMKIIPLSGDAFEHWRGLKENIDFFSYYKMIWFLIAVACTTLILVLNGYRDGFIYLKSKIYMPIVFYVACIIISTILSNNKKIALYGFTDRYEGMFVLIGYIIVMVSVISLVETESQIRLIIITLFISAAVISTIGIFQYIGYDLFQTELGKWIIVPSTYRHIRDSLKFTLGESILYSTLYHSNYVGSYMAMLFPLSFTILMLTRTKKIRVLMFFVTALMFAAWFGSNSRAGMVGGAFAFLILLLMIRKFIVRNWKYFLSGAIIFIILFFGLNATSNGRLFNQIGKLITNAVGFFQAEEVETKKAKNMTLKDVQVNGKNAKIETTKEILNIQLDGDKIKFTDNQNKNIEIKQESENGNILLLDNKYKDYNIKFGKYQEYRILQCKKDNFTLNFAIMNGEFKLLNGKGQPIDIKPIERIGFEGKESLGSARGYIWSRTFPLIFEKPLFGYGPDTFVIYFPQNDFMGKYNNYEGRMWELVDKPHNLYLQIAVSTGIPSLLAFLTIVFMYFISSVKVFFNNEYKESTAIIGVGIFAAIMGYLGAGLFNDSVVSVAPIFWVLFGLGLNINLKLLNSKRC
jgi:hypothetical protein